MAARHSSGVELGLSGDLDNLDEDGAPSESRPSLLNRLGFRRANRSGAMLDSAPSNFDALHGIDSLGVSSPYMLQRLLPNAFSAIFSPAAFHTWAVSQGNGANISSRKTKEVCLAYP